MKYGNNLVLHATNRPLPRKGTKTYTIVKMRLAGCTYDQILDVIGGNRNTVRVLFYNWVNREKVTKRYCEWQKKNRGKNNEYRKRSWKRHPEKKAYRNYYRKCWMAQVKPLTFDQWYDMEQST